MESCKERYSLEHYEEVLRLIEKVTRDNAKLIESREKVEKTNRKLKHFVRKDEAEIAELKNRLEAIEKSIQKPVTPEKS